MQVYLQEQREKKDDALWADTMRMYDELQQTVNSIDTLDEGE